MDVINGIYDTTIYKVYLYGDKNEIYTDMHVAGDISQHHHPVLNNRLSFTDLIYWPPMWTGLQVNISLDPLQPVKVFDTQIYYILCIAIH